MRKLLRIDHNKVEITITPQVNLTYGGNMFQPTTLDDIPEMVSASKQYSISATFDGTNLITIHHIPSAKLEFIAQWVEVYAATFVREFDAGNNVEAKLVINNAYRL